MTYMVSTPTGPVEIVDKVGDITYGSILTDAEGNKYVPQKQGYGVVPLEVAQAVAEQPELDEQTGNADTEQEPADDGASEDDVDSGTEGEEVSESEGSDNDTPEA